MLVWEPQERELKELEARPPVRSHLASGNRWHDQQWLSNPAMAERKTSLV